ncbi:hypothetical protein Pla100_28170 [Neorhodopirellula pilleata]|uniref:Uncharacterized protein n=1 Tax=Neorhodopirellula pilleata TaxID=2714738 RepID=A0A5C6AAB2_9BACT|nr:hypothetical protein Pla100_28170 [Neorhodopirellula pilleata]
MISSRQYDNSVTLENLTSPRREPFFPSQDSRQPRNPNLIPSEAFPTASKGSITNPPGSLSATTKPAHHPHQTNRSASTSRRKSLTNANSVQAIELPLFTKTRRLQDLGVTNKQALMLRRDGASRTIS